MLLTPDQEAIRDAVRDFCQAELVPHAARWDREHHFPRELFGELGELGLMGVCVPEDQGGAGADFLAYVLVLEELARADAGVAVTVAVHTSACTLPLLAHGSSPRGSLGLVQSAKALAVLRGRDYVLPVDVADLAVDVLAHRLVLTYEALAEEVAATEVVRQVLERVDPPQVAPSQTASSQFSTGRGVA